MFPNASIGILILALFVTTESADWGYENEKGPDHWADLFPEACAGAKQSPININTEDTVYNPALKDFSVFFDPPLPGSKFYVHNNGHTIQVNTEGKFFVSNGGLTDIYSTAQFHFHWGHKAHHGSEHTLDGAPSPIELHIVNWNSQLYNSIGEAAVEPNGLAVLGMLFEISEEDNPVLEPLVNVLMHVRDPDMKIKAEIPAVSMRAFLPRAADRYYRYNGSLTTPGCFESVVWTVFHEKLTISRRQLHVFRQVLKPSGHHVHKRSTRKHSRSRAVREVFEEIGIEDDKREQARFRRQIVKNTETHVHESLPEDATSHEETMEHHESNHTGSHGHEVKPHTGHHGHNVKPSPISAHPGAHESNMTHAEQVRMMLVNNYRPVQPLNGRVVYRSFPFFNEPINIDTEVVYIDKDNSELARGAATSLVSSAYMCIAIIVAAVLC
ncbi:carbonic anhydrase 7-like [Dreissena polymorpha]|uniref:carbonic anhydrase n=1 Tax=Dreissena polymorpha TaxID=45954 RepID=A0A9D4EXZ8_DREPO|nr:carbonic anhydrase 7-like [Dreissena polymorpha]KAH3788859.1 hypothetical protein DPMN_167021 [Dreissena polymorpha]